MLFLIEYDRESGKIVTFRSFDDSEREDAEHLRLEKELELNRREEERELTGDPSPRRVARA